MTKPIDWKTRYDSEIEDLKKENDWLQVQLALTQQQRDENHHRLEGALLAIQTMTRDMTSKGPVKLFKPQ